MVIMVMAVVFMFEFTGYCFDMCVVFVVFVCCALLCCLCL